MAQSDFLDAITFSTDITEQNNTNTKCFKISNLKDLQRNISTWFIPLNNLPGEKYSKLFKDYFSVNMISVLENLIKLK